MESAGALTPFRPHMTSIVERMQDDVEDMTRRLELEKRRLKRLDKQLECARQTFAAKKLQKAAAVAGRGATAMTSQPPRSLSTPRDRASAAAGREVAGTPRCHNIVAAGSEAGGPFQSRGSVVARLEAGASGNSERPSTAPRSVTPRVGASSRPLSSQGRQTLSSRQQAPSATAVHDGQAKSIRALTPCKLLKSRLDVQVQRLDVVKAENTRIKEEIDTGRKQRLQLNSIFQKLKAEIKQCTAELADFVREAEATRSACGNAQQKVALMRRRRDKERASFEDQVTQIRKNMHDYDAEKREIEVQLHRAKHGVQRKRDLIVPDEEHGFSESAMMRRIIKNAFLNCIQRRHIKDHQHVIRVFEQAFSTIKQSTGISSIEEIVKIFVSLEARNFSLLTYVNHMNREIEALEGVRRERRDAEQKCREQERQHEQQREEAISDLQKQLQSAELSIAEGRVLYDEQRELLQRFQPRVQEIGRRILRELDELRGGGGAGAGDAKLPRLSDEVSDDTLPQWLEWVEQALGRFRDAIPGHDKDHIFPITAAYKVKQLAPKRHLDGASGHPEGAPALVKAQELPSMGGPGAEDSPSPTGQKRMMLAGGLLPKVEAIDLEEDEEDDFADHPLMLKDIKSRAKQSLARKHRRSHRICTKDGADEASTPHSGSPSGPRAGTRLGRADGLVAGGAATEGEQELFSGSSSDDGHSLDAARRPSCESSVQRTRSKEVLGKEHLISLRNATKKKRASQLINKLSTGGLNEVSDDELRSLFLDKYQMSRAELELKAKRLGLHMSNLCFLKQEFDLYDADHSGYIEACEFRGLLRKLGEELSSEDLEAAFRALDADGSGEVEFFEFCEWFASAD